MFQASTTFFLLCSSRMLDLTGHVSIGTVSYSGLLASGIHAAILKQESPVLKGPGLANLTLSCQ